MPPKVNWENLTYGDTQGIGALLRGLKFRGTFDPINTLLKNSNKISSLAFILDDATFDEVIISKQRYMIDCCTSMFIGAKGRIVKFIGFDFSTIGTSWGGAVSYMFEKAHIDTIYIDNLNLTFKYIKEQLPNHTTTASYMFSKLECNTLRIDDIDMSGADNIICLFERSSIKNLELKCKTPTINSMNSMFKDARIYSDLDLSKIVTHKVINAESAFENCIFYGKLSLRNIDFSESESIIEMFSCSKIGTLDLVGTKFFNDEYQDAVYLSGEFSDMEIGTLIISKNDTELLKAVKLGAYKICNIQLV